MLSPVRSIPLPGTLVFLSGASIAAAEVAYFELGSAQFAAATPSSGTLVVSMMLAVAAGAELGGRIADRLRRAEPVLFALALCALLFAVVPSFLSSLSLSVALSVALMPLVMIGALAPYIARVAVPSSSVVWDSARNTGGVIGRVFSLGTSGAVAGALLAMSVLIPELGSGRTMVMSALLLATVALAPKVLSPIAGASVIRAAWLR
jgi:nitrate/nitrite transporter NarK